MVFLHLSDLHLGRRLGEASLLEDQRVILEEILSIAHTRADAVLITGDIYDKQVPSAEAVALFDWFLTSLSSQSSPVFLISGNHDSPERLEFGGQLFQKSGVFIASAYQGTVPRYTLSDQYGDIEIFLLPFLRPAMVRPYTDEEVTNYGQAVSAALQSAQPKEGGRSILLAHQFVTAGGTPPERSESELLSLGGLDNVDVSVFDRFDYVALGHIHKPQRIGRDTARYAGSPLKYSFSEARQKKGALLVHLNEKGSISFETLPLHPLRDLREIKGPYCALTAPDELSASAQDDYIRAILTDEHPPVDAIGGLRAVYPNLLRLDFEPVSHIEEKKQGTVTLEDIQLRSPLELFEEFYETQNQQALTDEQLKLLGTIFEQASGKERLSL